MASYTFRSIEDRRKIQSMWESGLTAKDIADDQRDALFQAIYLILNVERYAYPIYSWRYGVELADLIGKPKDYAMSEIKRRITEALMQDDRITAVDDWSFESGRKSVLANFKVYTIYGDLEVTKEVEI